MFLRTFRTHADNPAVLAVLVAVCFGGGTLALWMGDDGRIPVVVWPPGGVALVAMLLFSRSIWPVIFLGSFLAHVNATGGVAASTVHGIADAVEAVVGAALVERTAGGLNVFRRSDTLFRFLAIIALVSTPVSAAIVAGAGAIGGLTAWGDVAMVWMRGWLSHLSGVLVVAPFLALWMAGPFAPRRWLHALEAAVVIALVAGVSLAVFGDLPLVGGNSYPLEFICSPFLLWAAVRLGRRETATAVLVLTGVAIWGTLNGHGPFARGTPNEAVLLLQAYTSVTAIMGLVLASAITQRRDVEEQLTQLAITDPLTGLANYRRLIDVLRAEIARSKRTGRSFAVVFLDMDGLKRINDRHGHLIGSRALTRVADTLRTCTRVVDVPARYGGDEFAIVLPETDEAGGRVVLNRLQDRLATDTARPKLSVSGGVALHPRDGDSPTLLLRAADKLLYDAKARTVAHTAAATPDSERTGTLF